MNWAIFRETMRRNWKHTLYWGLGIGSLGLYIALFINDVNMLKQYADLAESMPPALLKMFGMGDAAALATPEGFIAFGVFGYALLITAVFAIMAGMNVTANDEDAGIMDVVLSAPIPRWRIVIEKFLVYTLITVIIAVLIFACLWLGLQGSAALATINMTRIVESTVNMIPATLLMIAATMFIAVVVRRKSTAMAIASVFVIASYFINFLGESVSGPAADMMRNISFFHYYNANDVIVNGLSWGNVGLLLGITALLVAGTVWLWQRRDVGV